MDQTHDNGIPERRLLGVSSRIFIPHLGEQRLWLCSHVVRGLPSLEVWWSLLNEGLHTFAVVFTLAGALLIIFLVLESVFQRAGHAFLKEFLDEAIGLRWTLSVLPC